MEGPKPVSLLQKSSIHLKLRNNDKNVMLSKADLYSIKQHSGEPVRKVRIRFQSKGKSCDYKTKCDNCIHDVEFSATILRDALVKRLDHEIKSHVLGNTG